MRVAIFMPITSGRARYDAPYWRKSITSLARGLSTRGVEVAVVRQEAGDIEDRAITDQCLLASSICERSGDFDLVHGFFDPTFATHAALIKTPVLMTLGGRLNASELRVFTKYRDRMFYVSLSEAARDPHLNYAASIAPGIEAEIASLHDKPGAFIVCPVRGLSQGEIVSAGDIIKRTGRKLVVTGGPGDKAAFEKGIRPLRGLDAAFLECSAPQEEIDACFRAYAVLCAGRRSRLISPFLEAMVSGTPVIALRGSAAGDLIVPGTTGFIASSGDLAAEMLTHGGDFDRSLCRTVAQERFSMDAMVESYLHVYSRITERAKSEDRRPWGYYEVLADEDSYKVKRIVVYPGKRLSLQRHAHRAEHWCVISGSGLVRCGDEEVLLKGGESIDIPKSFLHRIQNPGSDNLIFVEVQRGDYCGEDDIERFEDDYGRA